MKATGIVRKVDSLHRLVIPQEICTTQAIDEGTPLEIFMGENGEIILKKYQPTCGVCKESDDLVEGLVKYGIKVCHKCLKDAGE